MENINQPEEQKDISAKIKTEDVQGNPVAPTYNKPKLTPVFKMTEDALKTWWQNLDKILKIYWEGIKPTIIPLAVSFVLAILGFAVIKTGFISTALKVTATVSAVITMVLAIYFWTRAYIGVFLLIKKNYTDEAEQTFKETKELFWPYLGLSFLTVILVLLWCLLLIIPGIIFGILYSFAIYAFFFEGKKNMAAIHRSLELAKGYFWPIFGRFSFLMLLTWLLMMIIAIPLTFMPKNGTGAQIWNFITQVISWLIGPIALFFTYNMYLDLVKVKK